MELHKMPAAPAACSPAMLQLRMPLLYIAMSLMALTACMPPSSMPPPVPLPDGSRHQVGVAASGMLETESRGGFHLDGRQEALQLYTQHKAGERFTIGGQLTAGRYSVPVSGRWDTLPFGSVGFQVRYSAYRTERVVLGASLGGGWLYGQLGAPAALRLGDRLWIGTHPSVHYDQYWRWGGDVPVVVALQWDHASVALGSGLRVQQIASWYTNLRWVFQPYAAVSVARTW